MSKDSRIEIRTSKGDKELISKAAELEGMSLSTFANTCLLKVSRQVLLRAEGQIVLSSRDRDIFMQELDDNNPPTDALIALMASDD